LTLNFSKDFLWRETTRVRSIINNINNIMNRVELKTNINYIGPFHHSCKQHCPCKRNNWYYLLLSNSILVISIDAAIALSLLSSNAAFFKRLTYKDLIVYIMMLYWNATTFSISFEFIFTFYSLWSFSACLNEIESKIRGMINRQGTTGSVGFG